MKRISIIFGLLSVLLFVCIASVSAKTGKESQLAYSNAIACLENLDIERAYKMLDVIARGFPKSAESKKAALLKVVISATQFSGLDMLSTRYSEAVQKAKTDDVKREISSLYIKTSQEMIGSTRVLTNDVQALLKHADEDISLEVNKRYDSLYLAGRVLLPIKKLREGEMPTTEEIKMVEDSQKDISYRHVLGKVLGSSDLTAEKTIKGNVDWADTMMLMGNWLVHCGTVNKVGWIDPSTQKITRSSVQAEKSFLTAKQCFEKVREVSKDKQVQNQADARIKEINQILKEIIGGK